MRSNRRATLAFLLAMTVAGACGCLFPGLSDEEQKALEIHLDNGQAYLLRGRLLQAGQQFRKALAIDEDNKTARLALAWSLLKQKTRDELLEAETHLDQVIDDHPKDFLAHQGLGTTHFQLALILDYRVEELAGIPGDHAEDIRRKSDERERRLDEAVARFERVLELNPEYPHALVYLGQIAARRKQTEAALGFLERYLVLAERTRRYFQNRRGTAVLGDDLELISEKIESNIHKEVLARDLIANIYYDQGQPEKSVDQLNRIVAIDPENSEIYLQRARCWAKSGVYDTAIADIERFLRKTDRGFEDPVVRTAYSLLIEYRGRR